MSGAEAKKGGVLILQAVTSLLYGLLMAECRKPVPGRQNFFGPSAVLLFEMLKFVVSLIGAIGEQYGVAKSEVQHNDNAAFPISTTMSGYTKLTSVDEEKDNQDSDMAPSHALLARDDDKSSDGDEDLTLTEEMPTMQVRRVSTQESKMSDLMVSSAPNASSWAVTFLRMDETLISRTLELVANETLTLGAFRMSVPAILYVVQNNLCMVSAGYLSATEFQVFSQTKLIATAILSVLILGKALNNQHWFAIILLICGIVGAQLSQAPRLKPVGIAIVKAGSAANTTRAISQATIERLASPQWKTAIGITTILVACAISGLAAVLLEKLYKGKKSFWTLNLHLSFFSLIPALVPIFADTIQHHSFAPLRNFTPLVWLLVIVNAAGGFVVALVLRYADNILKGFAVSAALMATMLISAFVTQETVLASSNWQV